MDRRRFLSTCARALASGLLIPGTRLLSAAAPPAESADSLPDSLVDAPGIVNAPDLVLARGEARATTHRALEALGGMGRFVRPDQVVLVKPNASFPTPPDWGATTHPEVLAAVLEACFGAGARRVLVADHTMRDPERCFARNGTAEVVAAFPKARLIPLDREKAYRKVELPAGKALREALIPTVMQKADVFINLPTLKSHSATGVSLGLKNLMGLVWDRHRFHQEMDLHMGIADLGTILRPQLTILDAIRILKTGGPAGPGDVDTFDGVVAGVDPVAVDAYGAGLSTMNGRTYRADQIAYIRYAAEHGLGNPNLESLRIKELS